MDDNKEKSPAIELEEASTAAATNSAQEEPAPSTDRRQESDASAVAAKTSTEAKDNEDDGDDGTPLLSDAVGSSFAASVHNPQTQQPIHVSKETDNWGAVAKAQLKREAQEYRLKDVQWQDTQTRRIRDVKIVTQNENGPCPLIALVNVLVLSGSLSIGPASRQTITDEDLIGMLGDYLFRNEATESSDTEDGGRQVAPGEAPSVDDVSTILSLLPTLSHGLDVDLQFSHIYDFATTPATRLFKAFNVDLVHGWVVDPESERYLSSVLLNDCRNSYEGAVEFIFAADELSHGQVVEAAKSENRGVDRAIKEAEEQERQETSGRHNRISTLFKRKSGAGQLSTDQQQTVYNAIALNEWLDCNATQLTEFGLRMLGTMLPSNHLCVLFRNNHFSTLFKRAPGELFILCTDAGVAGDDRIVWESLRDVHQMTSEFLDSRFARPAASGSGGSGGSGAGARSLSASSSPHDAQSQKQHPQAHLRPNDSGSPYSSGSSDEKKGKGRDGSAVLSSGDFVQEAAPHTTTDSSQIDEDYALALSLQEEEDRQIQRKDDRQKLQVRQQDKMPPGMDMREHGHLYGVPVVTKEGEKKLAQAIFRTKSDENFSRQMADTFLPHESAAKAQPQYTKSSKSSEDRCVIC